MTFARFMALALYDPKVGYYTRNRNRVGYAPGTDFFTASTSGPVFGELIAAACRKLLGDRDPTDYEFVEIGAESESGVLTGVTHGFRQTRIVRVGAPLRLEGRCVVFSNELFDAQPFTRYIRRGDRWRELGIELTDGTLVECEFTPSSAPPLPSTLPEGYIIDAPLSANSLLAEIAGQPWSGLFVACDYGKSWDELISATPRGTARAYFRHTQSNDLLARPGEQDLTCHVCWDWLIEQLTANRFRTPLVESQESFFVRHATDYIAAATAADAAHFSHRKLALMQLLHPSHLGQKFQVLHCLRD